MYGCGAQFTGTVSNITPQARQGVVSFVVRLDNPRDSRLRCPVPEPNCR